MTLQTEAGGFPRVRRELPSPPHQPSGKCCHRSCCVWSPVTDVGNRRVKECGLALRAGLPGERQHPRSCNPKSPAAVMEDTLSRRNWRVRGRPRHPGAAQGERNLDTAAKGRLQLSQGLLSQRPVLGVPGQTGNGDQGTCVVAEP